MDLLGSWREEVEDVELHLSLLEVTWFNGGAMLSFSLPLPPLLDDSIFSLPLFPANSLEGHLPLCV